ncbi:major facilitator superfamily transporter [Glonium stellatum]|uniref:Major facilitator superfamily transporter n=1 Tax=Glonium stellatum TaxID=574774 RepID=A0A8E2ERV3_9PEZI|nr:major facilitator superfamily transporter [Glonium stellatum]
MANGGSVVAFPKEALTVSIASSFKEKDSPQHTYLHHNGSWDEESTKPGPSVSEDSALEENLDPNIVTWDGPNDPANPKNWSRARKWANTIVASLFAFISPLSSSMAAPALVHIGNDLHISNSMDLQLVLSVFLLAYSFGPFILSPCSEIWGRKRVIHFGNLIFITFNTACGFASTKNEIIAFRFIAGLGGSATLGIGAGILSDCWPAEERGRGTTIYQLAPVLGPAIGPIAGGFISEYATWRWTFWSLSCFNVAIQLAGLLFFQETYAPRILAIKARELRQKTGNQELRTEWQKEGRTLPHLLRVSLTRPWRLLGTQPTIQLLALYQAFNFGMLYLFISSFPMLWTGRYGMSTSIGSLNYCSLALGLLVGAQICGPLTDLVYKHLKKRYGHGDDSKGLPEFRIPLMIPAAFIVPCGIFLYGWSAEAKLFWIVPNIGAALFASGSIISYLCTQMYIVDTYARYAASASAASTFLRSLAAFSFPLFVPYLFNSLGYGLGSSTLGLAAIVLGIPAPFLFWRYGATLRARSPFAAGG